MGSSRGVERRQFIHGKTGRPALEKQKKTNKQTNKKHPVNSTLTVGQTSVVKTAVLNDWYHAHPVMKFIIFILKRVDWGCLGGSVS